MYEVRGADFLPGRVEIVLGGGECLHYVATFASDVQVDDFLVVGYT